jgi:SAM-dependent methyltransferase
VQQFTTDKIGHGYLGSYESIAAELGGSADVLEIGVANGEGLVLFRHLFPRGRLVGVDNNPRAYWREAQTNAFKIVADQDDPSLPNIIATATGVHSFDLIVDDASHDNIKTKQTFLTMWPMLRPLGVYVIEDWNHAGGLCFQLASELPVKLLREDMPIFSDVESIHYRHGLIIMRKTTG